MFHTSLPEVTLEIYFIFPVLVLWVEMFIPESQVLLDSGYVIYNNQRKISDPQPGGGRQQFLNWQITRHLTSALHTPDLYILPGWHNESKALHWMKEQKLASDSSRSCTVKLICAVVYRSFSGVRRQIDSQFFSPQSIFPFELLQHHTAGVPHAV